MKSYGEFYKSIVGGPQSNFLRKVNSAYFQPASEESTKAIQGGANYQTGPTQQTIFYSKPVLGYYNNS